MDQAAEDNFVTENLETAPGSSSGEVTEVMDSTENVVDVVPDIQSKYMKNKTGDAKQKFRNAKTKEMTVASGPEGKTLKRKAVHPPTSEMVMDSITTIKKRNGVSLEDLRKYVEEKYEVDMKRLKYNVDKFLQKGVGNGILEKIGREGTEGRFKIKKSENIKKDPKNLPRKQEKGESEKKLAATKKRVIIKKDPKKLPRKEGKVKPDKKLAATKKQVNIKKDPKKLPRKEGKVKPDKKLAATKKQVNIKKDPKKLPRKERKVKPEKKLGATKMQVNIKKDPKNLPRKEGKVKPEKKLAVTKIQVK